MSNPRAMANARFANKSLPRSVIHLARQLPEETLKKLLQKFYSNDFLMEEITIDGSAKSSRARHFYSLVSDAFLTAKITDASPHSHRLTQADRIERLEAVAANAAELFESLTGVAPAERKRKTTVSDRLFYLYSHTGNGNLIEAFASDLQKVLTATATVGDLVEAVIRKTAQLDGYEAILPGRRQRGGFFDDAGASWDETDVPGVTDQNAYVLEITGDSMLPVYREGDLIIVSPKAEIRANDRVVIKTTDGTVRARLFCSQNQDKIELAHFDPAKPREFIAPAEVDWMARIIWATQ